MTTKALGSKALAKVTEALTQLMEGYAELQAAVEEDLGSTSDDEDVVSSEVDTGVISEVRSALETLVENEDYSVEEIASVIATLTEGLQELDPDIFEGEEDEDEDEDEDEVDDDEDEDIDLDEDDDGEEEDK